MQASEILEGIFEKQESIGYSLQQLADASKVPRSTIERIKRGETRNPSLQTVLDLAGAVGYQFGPPILDKSPENPKHTQQLIRTYEDQIARLRAHYNMLLAEKNRWITYLFRITLILVGFIIGILIFDVLNTDRGWIQDIIRYYDSAAAVPATGAALHMLY